MIAVSTANGAPVDIKEAGVIAKNLFYERANINGKIGYDAITIDEVFTETRNSQNVMYIFNVADGRGFVIIAADDIVYPVLGYSDEGSYTAENRPPAFTALLNYYAEQIVYARENSQLPDKETTDAWSLYATKREASKDIQAVTPLCATTWNQDCYYNQLCPTASGGPCNKAYAGCVATAMAQIMKYHNYPTTGTGTHSYTHPTYGTLSANYGATTYGWANMPNNLSSGSSATQKTAVATLIYHAGVAVNMDYDPGGSGAYNADAPTAFISHFGYNNTAQYASKSSYSNLQWALLIKGDLDNSLPVLYGGSNSGGSGGHSFVCDGYQGTGLYTDAFHFNWGWSGYDNGYFLLSNLATSNGTFSYYCDAVVHINHPGGVTPGTCDTVTNILQAETPTCYSFSSAWGFWTGTNEYGWSKFAEKFTGLNNTLNGVYIAVAKAVNASPSAQVAVKVYSNGTLPGTLLRTTNVTISTLQEGYYNLVSFTPALTTTGSFYISVEVPYNTPIDTVAVYSAPYRGTGGLNTAYVFADIGSGAQWYPYDSMNTVFTTSLAYYAATCNIVTAVEDAQSTEPIIYPNPAIDEVNINTGIPTTGEMHVRIYSLSGVLVKEITAEHTENGAATINVSDLRQGLYLLDIVIDKYHFSNKLSILR
jgi:hypothetical protein